MEPHGKRAEVCFDEAGSRGETEFPLASGVEKRSKLQVRVRPEWEEQRVRVCVCVFNVICMAAYQLSMAWLTILGTG